MPYALLNARIVRSFPALVVALCSAMAACSAEIESGLSQEQANEVIVALDTHGIAATKEREDQGGDEASYTVHVATDDSGRALRTLRARSLPKRPEPGLSEVFGESSLVPTATEERARYAAALSGELARSVEAISGVVDARVHVAIPDTQNFALDDAAPKARASVLVKYQAGSSFDARAIRALVAGAVEGMRDDDVAVVGVRAAALPRGTPSLVHVGPIAVTRGSAFALKAMLAAALGLHLVLALCLVVVLSRKRRSGELTTTSI